MDTDPRARGTLSADQVPWAIGHVRRVADEVSIAADAIARESGGGAIYSAARMLDHHAIRLGQAAVLLSAVPLGEVALVHLPPNVPVRRRVIAAAHLAWVVLRGR